MSGRETLQAFRDTAAEIRRLERELEETRSQAERVIRSYSPSPGGSGDGRQLENAAIRLDTLGQKFCQLVDLQVARRYDVERVLDRLPNTRDRRLLRLRYVDRMPWPQIGEALSLTLRHLYRIHGDLLAVLDDLDHQTPGTRWPLPDPCRSRDFHTGQRPQ